MFINNNQSYKSVRPKVLVVGDGLVGISAVLALANKPVDVAWVGPQVTDRVIRPDDRSIVLNAVSQCHLAAWGVWEHLVPVATPIVHVEVSDRGRWGKCRFSAEEAQLPALGYVVPAHQLLMALHQCACVANIEKIAGSVVDIKTDKDNAVVDLSVQDRSITWVGEVVLAADGTRSLLRQQQDLALRKKDYAQVAIAAQVRVGQRHAGIAYERFTPEGPIAMLPRGNGRYGVVWVVDKARANAVMAWSDKTFLLQLQKAFGTKLGLFSAAGARQHYPLGLAWMPLPVGDKVVYLGNAAQTLHPVMGQGFNLGLRDVVDVCKVWDQASWRDLGAAHSLLRYAKMRESDRQKVMHLSDGVVTGFSSDCLPLAMLRSGLLGVVDLSLTLKRAVAHLSMGQPIC